jgi:hypothetical protein
MEAWQRWDVSMTLYRCGNFSVTLVIQPIIEGMNFDDFNEPDSSNENSEIGSDDLLSDDDLRLPESAHMLVRIHAVQAWLAHRIEETKLEVGETALALQEVSMQTTLPSGNTMRRREREAAAENTRHLQQAINDAQERLHTYEEAEALLQESLDHASGERVLVEFYLSLENIIQEESQCGEYPIFPEKTTPRQAALADVQQRVERVGIPFEED